MWPSTTLNHLSVQPCPNRNGHDVMGKLAKEVPCTIVMYMTKFQGKPRATVMFMALGVNQTF